MECSTPFYILLLWVSVPTSTAENEPEKKCDTEILLDATSGKISNISSPGYPNKLYTPGTPYTWCLSAPVDMTISIHCEEFDIPKSGDCETNALAVSQYGEDEEPRAHCGSTPFHVKSSSNNMTLSLHSSKKSRGGKFSCQVQVEEKETLSLRTIVYQGCDCGNSLRMRIVGGQKTQINEFPFMAGLVDARWLKGAVICGATIISHNYVITAEHCLEKLVVDKTGVLVGEHDYSKGSETSDTQLIRAKRFIRYPFFDKVKTQYDLALIELAYPIIYSVRVGPVCLPFSLSNMDLTGKSVTILGWGSIEFGGPRSSVLRKVNVDVVDIQKCIDTYGSDIDAYTQMCTYRAGADACQFDSGGPLVYYNYKINRYQLMGLISYGRSCASKDPAVNIFVPPFLQYILDMTAGETYCYK